MAITQLDTNTALIVIDLQKGIVGIPTVHRIDGVIRNARALADAFRAHRSPVVLVNADGGAPGRTEAPGWGQRPEGWDELVPELQPQPKDHRVTKRTWGAFTNTDLEQYLKAQDVTQVVVVGVATSAGVESTARHAHELGFHVTVATDAVTDRNEDSHRHSIARIFPRIGETSTTQEIIALLDSRTV